MKYSVAAWFTLLVGSSTYHSSNAYVAPSTGFDRRVVGNHGVWGRLQMSKVKKSIVSHFLPVTIQYVTNDICFFAFFDMKNSWNEDCNVRSG